MFKFISDIHLIYFFSYCIYQNVSNLKVSENYLHYILEHLTSFYCTSHNENVNQPDLFLTFLFFLVCGIVHYTSIVTNLDICMDCVRVQGSTYGL